MRRRRSGAFLETFFAVTEGIANLAHKELSLFRAETRETLRSLCLMIVFAVLGVAVAVIAAAFLGAALFEWLVVVLASRILAALSVGVIAAVIAACLFGMSCYCFNRVSFVPMRTLESLRQDSRAFFGEPDDE